MVIVSLLDIDIRILIEGIERACSISLPRRVTETYLDPEAGILYLRFAEPIRTETGEPLPLKALATIFRDEDTGEITAIEILKLEELLKELNL
ncbi:MAG: hypothetical protein RMI85_03940 [Candidatus Korarchaeum sp.]|nr:hypothetical protein [Candidatus Korarchaeum sp.]